MSASAAASNANRSSGFPPRNVCEEREFTEPAEDGREEVELSYGESATNERSSLVSPGLIPDAVKSPWFATGNSVTVVTFFTFQKPPTMHDEREEAVRAIACSYRDWWEALGESSHCVMCACFAAK